MGQVNVNGPDRSNSNGNGPSYTNGPDRWEPVVRYVVWTICALIVIAVLVYGTLFVFHDVVNTLRVP